ncbi:MAG: oligosaccharide flippase family protein [Thermoleophilaceae bacterium]
MDETALADPVAVSRAPTTGAVARAISWKALSVLVGQGSWYASLFVLAILVPPDAFGVIAVGSVIVSFTTLLLESGTGGSLIIAPRLDAGSVRGSVLRTSAAGLAFTALFFALATPIAHEFASGSNPDVLRALAPVVGLSAAWIVPNALLIKYLQFKRIAIVAVAAAVTASLAAVLAGALGAGVWALVTRLLVSQVLLTALTWVAAIRFFPRAAEEHGPPVRREGALAFLAIASAGFVAWTCDTLAVGAFTNATQLGIYALAFSLAYAPLTQVSWTIGNVLLPAVAAARDPELVRRQTLKALRMMALLLLPILPPAIALARGLIPTLLGSQWSGMVVPFQILVVVGVGQGLANVLGETLAGVGGPSVRGRARIDVVWALSTLALIVVGVQTDGIRGAAIVHVIAFCGLASAYVWWTARSVGLPAASVLGDLRPVVACVLVQALVTAAVGLGAAALGAGALAAGLAGAGAGALALGLALRVLAPDLLAEGRDVIGSVLRRRRSTGTAQ